MVIDILFIAYLLCIPFAARWTARRLISDCSDPDSSDYITIALGSCVVALIWPVGMFAVLVTYESANPKREKMGYVARFGKWLSR